MGILCDPLKIVKGFLITNDDQTNIILANFITPGQSLGSNSDVLIRPAAIFKDPFRRGDNILVMCETYGPDDLPHPTNHRDSCNKAMQAVKDQKPWFGIEQVRKKLRTTPQEFCFRAASASI